MKADLIAVKDSKGDEGAFTSLVQKVLDNAPDAKLILISDNAGTLAAGGKLCGDRKPLLLGADSNNREAMANLARNWDAHLGYETPILTILLRLLSNS